jgi:hypothetical protein
MNATPSTGSRTCPDHRVRDLAHLREALPGPMLEALEAPHGVVRLSRLVVFAADEEHVATIVGRTAEPDVVEGVGRVPQEDARQAVARHDPDRPRTCGTLPVWCGWSRCR